jgi:acyl-CoA thioester hydrolase
VRASTSAIRAAAAAELREVARYRVIYGDTDQMGVVYYGNYLRFFEIARNEFLRQAGARYHEFEEKHRLMLPVVEATIRYRRPARYDDELAIYAAITDVRGASARFVYEIRRLPDGESLVDGHTVHACIDRDGRVARIPAELRAALGGGINGPSEPPPPLRARGT